jgi:hypothetical protein
MNQTPSHQGPPENPPPADFHLPLTQHYPPHGFPPYLGLGLLDRQSLRLDPGESRAEYRHGSDLVYRLRARFDAADNPAAVSACDVRDACWEIEEFFDGQPWRKTANYRSLPQVFYHHLAGQLPTENPRVAALLHRLTQKHLVAVRCRHQCSFIMFPAGYLYSIRVPLTDATFDNFRAFAEASPDDLDVPWPQLHEPQPAVILKSTTSFDTEVERGVVSDVDVSLYRLIETIERLDATGADAGPVHLRPEVIYAHERSWKHSAVHPGKLYRNIVTYKVVPIDEDTPSFEGLEPSFANDSLEIYLLVHEGLHSEPPENDPLGPPPQRRVGPEAAGSAGKGLSRD